MATTVPLYTGGEYEALVEHGLLGPDDRVELLEGVIVTVSPQSPRHAAVVRFVEEALRAAIGGAAEIRSQMPLRAGSLSMPEPDVAVVPGRAADYLLSHPAEALLVVEVADTSLTQDRMTKERVYAAAGVTEYWIVDVAGDAIEVHQDPDPDGRHYRQRSIAHRGEVLSLVAFPDATVAAADMLGPSD
jgi:Uma2 family endonuclease